MFFHLGTARFKTTSLDHLLNRLVGGVRIVYTSLFVYLFYLVIYFLIFYFMVLRKLDCSVTRNDLRVLFNNVSSLGRKDWTGKSVMPCIKPGSQNRGFSPSDICK